MFNQSELIDYILRKNVYLRVTILWPVDPPHEGRAYPGERPGEGPHHWPVNERFCQGEVSEAARQGPAVPGVLNRNVHGDMRAVLVREQSWSLVWDRCCGFSSSAFICVSLPAPCPCLWPLGRLCSRLCQQEDRPPTMMSTVCPYIAVIVQLIWQGTPYSV